MEGGDQGMTARASDQEEKSSKDDAPAGRGGYRVGEPPTPELVREAGSAESDAENSRTSGVWEMVPVAAISRTHSI